MQSQMPSTVACRAPTALSQCLNVLEHASFACPANEQHLVQLSMQPLASTSCQEAGSRETSNGNLPSAAQPFPAWLVRQIQQMQSGDASPSDCQQPDWSCVQSALSVLINMTHNSPEGCAGVMTAGGMQMAVSIVSGSMQRQTLDCEVADAAVTPRSACLHDRRHLLTDVGPITAALGLLINLVEDCADSRQQLKAMQLSGSSSDPGILHLLCRLMQASLPAPTCYHCTQSHRVTRGCFWPDCCRCKADLQFAFKIFHPAAMPLGPCN